MRLWSLHPKYLDRQGLLALWREGLLAQKVLQGATRGYRNHPQLTRFKAQPDPVLAIGHYLTHVVKEAERRAYRFDASKIEKPLTTRSAPRQPSIMVNRGQLAYEFEHLKRKLKQRSPDRLALIAKTSRAHTHPLFVTCPGGVENWERT